MVGTQNVFRSSRLGALMFRPRARVAQPLALGELRNRAAATVSALWPQPIAQTSEDLNGVQGPEVLPQF